ncbi:zinc protease [Alysiella filiformis DSM 16848]|uniref:Zinc protease n=2 Tax=Alysiella TaxID=194195 RepID=A0A286E8J4_9NEIS|nr:zinc protease [Alysiella filiformis DSM 16848]
MGFFIGGIQIMFGRKTLFTALLLAWVMPAWAQTLKATLPNGLQVIVREDHRAPVVMSQIWYRVGSVDEKVGKSGLSHALEHMMFKGTPNVPSGEFSRRVSAMGGVLNAYTSPTETVFHENAAKEHLPKLLEMEADRMVNLNFSNRDFNNEMKVIREERRQTVDDNPINNMYEQMLFRAYDKPSNRTAVIGHMRDLHGLKAADLRDWYKKWYAPNNATMVIVGDVNAQETLDLVKQKFAHIPAKKLPERQNLQEKEVKKAVSAHAYGNTQQPIMLLGYRVPHLRTINDTTPYALDMLATILGSHSASRFETNLVRGKQLALEMDSSYTIISRQPQMFHISAMPREGVSTAQLKAEIEAQIADIAQNGVSEAELQQARVIQESSLIFSRDSMANQAAWLGTLESNGFDFSQEDELYQRVLKVSAAEIQAAAKLLTPQREVYIVMYPHAMKQKRVAVRQK